MIVAYVPSDSGDKNHTIRQVGDQMVCTCYDHLFRSNGEHYVCKHIAQVAAEMFQFVHEAKQSKQATAVLTAATANV